MKIGWKCVNIVKKILLLLLFIAAGYGDLRTKLSSVIEARCLVGKAGSILSRDQSPVLLVMLLSIISRSVVICNSVVFESGMLLLIITYRP